ncbi:ENV2 protein, partial [Cephalopterus ornatus]|nr:ENV2 protein [Cephalopterus ornatus]
MLQASYQVLNATYPNITEHCWLCYDIRPPFYEAIGVDSRFKKANGTNPAQCLWNEESGHKQGITMSQVSGKGKCIG